MFFLWSHFANVIFVEAALKMCFLKEKFFKKCFENVFFQGAVSNCFLREKFQKNIFQENNFESVFFEGAVTCLSS